MMVPKGSEGGRRMFSPSLEIASKISDWANAFFIGSLVVGVVSTVLIVRMANVKEEHWDELRRSSDERIAEATARQKEAELKLEQLRKLAGPREIKQTEFLKLIEGVPKSKLQIWYSPTASDGMWLASQIAGAIIAAKWELTSPPMPIPDTPPEPNEPFAGLRHPLMRLGAQPNGVTVVAYGAPADIDKENPSGQGLIAALAGSMQSAASLSYNLAVPDGVLRIIVGPKQDPILPTTPAVEGFQNN